MTTAIVHEKVERHRWLDNGVLGAIGYAMATARRWQRRQASRNRLLDLDDRMLADIGLTRSDAVQEAAKRFWQD